MIEIYMIKIVTIIQGLQTHVWFLLNVRRGRLTFSPLLPLFAWKSQGVDSLSTPLLNKPSGSTALNPARFSRGLYSRGGPQVRERVFLPWYQAPS